MTTLIPDSLFPSSSFSLERHPAQYFAQVVEGTSPALIAQVTLEFPPGDRAFVIGSLSVLVEVTSASGSAELIDLQVGLVTKPSLNQFVTLERRRAVNGRVGDEGRTEGMTTFANGSGRSFNFPDLKGLILPNQYLLQVFTQFVQATGFTSQRIKVDCTGYAIPQGLLLR